MAVFSCFIGVPLIEIALFIQVGGLIGLWPTLGVVVLTAVLGSVLVRSQGAQALANLRNSFNDLNDPTEPLVHGAMILFSGALLLTPGFFTDALGFALLVPGFRKLVLRELRKRVKVGVGPFSGQQQWSQSRQDPDVIIEGDYEVDETSPGNGSSGWTRH